MIDSVIDLVKVLDTLNKRDDIQELVEEVQDLNALASSNSAVLDSEDEYLRDTIIQLEMCLSYYLFDTGIVDKGAENKLKKIGFNISKLDDKDYGFSYSVNCDNFSILFSL